MKPAGFQYHRAASVEEAIHLMETLGEDAKFIAGGQSLVPMMNFRLARPTALIDITRIPGLHHVKVEDGCLRIGALTTHQAVERVSDPVVLFRLLGTRARGALDRPSPHPHARHLRRQSRSRGSCRRVVHPRTPSRGGRRRGRALAYAHDLGSQLLRGVPGDRAGVQRDDRRGSLPLVGAPRLVPRTRSPPRRLCSRGCWGEVGSRGRRMPIGPDSPRGSRRHAGSIPRRGGGPDRRTIAHHVFDDAARASVQGLTPVSDVHASSRHRRRLAEVLVCRALDDAVGFGASS